jgi:hypothetical protein
VGDGVLAARVHGGWQRWGASAVGKGVVVRAVATWARMRTVKVLSRSVSERPDVRKGMHWH